MLFEFVAGHRERLVALTREKVAKRSAPIPTERELTSGVPLFLDQLTAMLRGPLSATTETIERSAAAHGAALLNLGYTVGQVVHDYGDICQAIMELADETNEQITAEEFHTLNRCLDDAIAESVTEYARLRDRLDAEGATERSSAVALELRNRLSAAQAALLAIQSGRVPIGGSVAAVLARNLQSMTALINRAQLGAPLEPAGARGQRRLAEDLQDMARALAAARESAESRDRTLRDDSIQLRQILAASRKFSESLKLSYVVGAVQTSTAAVGGYQRVIVWLTDDGAKQLVNAEESATTAPSYPAVERGEGVAARAAQFRRTTFEGPDGQVRFSDSNVGPVRAIAIPLLVGARVVGALEVRRAEAKATTRREIDVVEMLATHAATAIESARLHELTEERSHMDPLTLLFNRRRLDEDLAAECKRCVRYGRPLAFVMLDVDNFKAFNDSHGHPQADTALKELADVIAGSVRTTDTAYRYGGEEFCILLRETSAQDAMVFAERVRQRIEKRFESGTAQGITASLGVAEFSVATPMPEALVEAADAAMYESKHTGRNRVVLSLIPPGAVDLPNGDLAPHLL